MRKRTRWVAVVVVEMVVAGGLAGSAGCGSILGLSDPEPFPDGGNDAPTGPGTDSSANGSDATGTASDSSVGSTDGPMASDSSSTGADAADVAPPDAGPDTGPLDAMPDGEPVDAKPDAQPCNESTCPTGCCAGGVTGACVAYGSQSNGSCGTGGATCRGCGENSTCSTGTCSCNDRFAACGASTGCPVNIADDPHNCGFCNNDCTFGTDAGATCNLGACTGFAIANEPYNGSSNHDGCTLYGPIDTSASDSYLYFASEDTLYTVLKSGGAASAVQNYSPSSQNNLCGIDHVRHSTTHISWMAESVGSPGAAGIGFTSPTLAPSVTPEDLDQPCPANEGGDDVVFVEGQDDVAYSCYGNGGSFLWMPNGPGDTTSSPIENALASDYSSRVWYWCTLGTIQEWTPTSNTKFQQDTNILSLAFGNSALYWTSTGTTIGAGGEAVVRAPVDSDAGAKVVAPLAANSLPANATQALNADSNGVCWLQQTGVFCLLAGATQAVQVSVAATSAPLDMTMDSSAVYWSENGAATSAVLVFKAPRPSP